MRLNTQWIEREGEILQRLFSTFPDGWPGVALLLLRATVGITAVIQGGMYLADRGSTTFEIWLVGLLVVVSGISLSIGFLTPVAGAMVALATIAIGFSWLPAPTPNLFNAPLPTILVVIVAAAIAFLGPGSLSFDCRLFGRREIIIPHPQRPPKA